MLVEFSSFLRRQLLLQGAGIALISAFLCFALWRNSTEQEPFELLLASLAIIWGISFALLRDQPGYWVYAALSLKFMMGPQALQALERLSFAPGIRLLSPLQWPWVLPSLLTLLVGVGLWIGLSLFTEHSMLLVVLSLVLLLPLLLCAVVRRSAPYFVILAGAEGEAMMLQASPAKRRLQRYITEDLLISMGITFTLILPLQSHPRFSLEYGYTSASFIWAATVLSLVAATFLLLGARRSRLMAHVGEQLSAIFAPANRAEFCLLGGWSLPQRALLYGVLALLWTLTVCAGLGWLWPGAPFALFSLFLLLGLAAVYGLERQHCLANDYRLARQFIDEMQVEPASVARRALAVG